ncbi:MAG: hypothetical protein Q9199_006759 [Rusavskia elegans]
MTGINRSDSAEMSFMDAVHEDDIPLMQREWHLLTAEQSTRSFEIRLRKKKKLLNGELKHVTILASAVPEMDENGLLKSISGTTMDISEIKQAHENAVELSRLQRQSRIEAEEAKAAQERHIDITSHEMRNPLSAILQSADSIWTTLTEYKSSPNESISNLLDATLESASIITLCAQQQNRILNDVLTLSKLDSGILPVTASLAQPLVVARDTLKMFEGELQSSNIEWKFVVDETYKQNTIDWVMCDPSRLSQVLINLMTNAIKFTRNVGTSIIVTIGGSEEKPPFIAGKKIDWFPSKSSSAKRDLTLDSEWGKGQQVFLSFAVRDTGRGLSEEEKKKLFQRFSQASPRTHVEFGGSGLGLFISRELTELQGGEIGVASESGKGSTFAFYVKGRRGAAPEVEDTLPHRPKSSAVSNVAPSSLKIGKDLESNHAPLNVLLVEDNLINQKVLQKQLMKHNYQVQVANHGLEAIEYLETTNQWRGNETGKQVDVVLMDLEMPVMDGISCARKIRELQREGTITQHIPLIAVTANARKEQIESTMEAGMVRPNGLSSKELANQAQDDVMTKPFEISQLLPKIERLKTLRT